MDSKSNEITAIPALLDQLSVKNSIVTLDAMGCQTAIAQKIIDREADYLLALKKNHRQAHQAVADHFDQACFDRAAPGRAVLDEFDDGHGRLVRRRVFVSTEAAGLEALGCWPGLHAVLAVETIRSVNGSARTVAELRYFLTSGHDAPEVLAKAIRKHWAIENNLLHRRRRVIHRLG